MPHCPCYVHLIRPNTQRTLCGRDSTYLSYRTVYTDDLKDACAKTRWCPACQKAARKERPAMTRRPRKWRYPVRIQFINDEQGGYYLADHPDFGSACTATGETYEQAVRNLGDVREAIVALYKTTGRKLPKPGLVQFEQVTADATGWKPDNEFLRRERKMIERNLRSPWAKKWKAEMKVMDRRLKALDPQSKEAIDLRWRIRMEQRRFGVAVRPVQ